MSAPTQATRMSVRENTLRTIRFEKPEWIPMQFRINGACWAHYETAALEDLMSAHPLLFPGFEPQGNKRVPWYAPDARADEPLTDPWGSVWETSENGITGAVTRFPLADWSAFEQYRAPDPEHFGHIGPLDWENLAEQFAQARAAGNLCAGSLHHGHTFLRLTYLRGYENLLFDMEDDEPRLRDLIDTVEAFNLHHVRRFLGIGVDIMGYPEDLGMQIGPMLSPGDFRRFIKPSYERLMQPAREAGVLVHMHSDGDIRALVEDLIDGGVQSLNLQDLVNGIDWIRDTLKGRVCIDLDIDRQKITRFGSPDDIDSLIRKEVETLGSPEGGLSMIYGLYPGVPLDNVAALMDAMERYAGHFA